MRWRAVGLILTIVIVTWAAASAEVFETKQAGAAEAKRLAAIAQAESAFIAEMQKLLKSHGLPKNGEEAQSIDRAIYAAQVRLAKASVGPGVYVIDASERTPQPTITVKAKQVVTYKVTGRYTFAGGDSGPEGKPINGKIVGKLVHYTYRLTGDVWDGDVAAADGARTFKASSDGVLAWEVADPDNELKDKRGILRLEIAVK